MLEKDLVAVENFVHGMELVIVEVGRRDIGTWIMGITRRLIMEDWRRARNENFCGRRQQLVRNGVEQRIDRKKR